MFQLDKIRNVISLSSIFFINLIFIYKYSVTYFYFPILIGVIYIVSFFIILTYLIPDNSALRLKDFIEQHFYTISLILIIIGVIFIYSIPRVGLIGRETAIEEWLRLLFEGVYPYISYITPSAFPLFYFLILPFYLINSIGLLEVFGLAGFLYLIKMYSGNKKALSLGLFLLFSSPVIYYDFVVRSELTFNIVLALLVIYSANKKNLLSNKGQFILFGILFGVVLSTRSVVVIPLMTFLLYYFKQNLTSLIKFGLIMAAVFVLQLLPFILWDIQLFLDVGPFAIQSTLADLPKWFIVLCLLASIYSGWAASDIKEVYFSSGIILLCMIIISYISKIFQYGFEKAFFGDNYIDPSYLAFVLPFFILSISAYKVDRFLGKILR